MPITLNCACGKILRVADENAGKRVKCPACNAVIAPPAPEPDFVVLEDEPAKHPAAKAHDDDDDGGDYGMKPAATTPDEPKKKPKFRRRADVDDYDDDYPTRRRRSRGSSGLSSDAVRKIVYSVIGLVLTLLGAAAAVGSQSARGSVTGACVALGGLIMIGRAITNNMPGSD